MIVRMKRALVACHHRDRDALLRRLHELGVLHIVPAQQLESEQNGDARDARMKQFDTAIQALHAVQPHGPRPQLDSASAVREVLSIWDGGEAARSRLDALYREAEHLRAWGDVRVDDLRALAAAGVALDVSVVPESALPALRAQLVVPLQRQPQHRRVVATIGLDPATLPRFAERLPAPTRDRCSVHAEAAGIEAALERDRARLSELAWLLPDLARERDRLAAELEWARAARSGLTDDAVYAVQGWLPAERADRLARELAAHGINVAVRTRDPLPEEHPPTLVRYRAWARPIEGLFRMLGMVPGYDEVDASSIFMIAVPVFAGMIIGDAGYGLLFLMLALFARRATTRLLGRDLQILLTLSGAAALAWGAITGVWFGVVPRTLIDAGGALAVVGAGLDAVLLVRGSEEHTRTLLIQLCFLLGAAHLIMAHARRLVALAPDVRALAELGWCIVLAAMLGLIWLLFFGADAVGQVAAVEAAVMAVGLLLVAVYSRPDRPWASRLGLGFAGSLLPLLSTFGDTLSYIRLMAVGLASYYLGSTFNLLAANTAHASSWVLGGFVLLAGHTLNIGLILIAIFAHGVRLNLLEFSSNAGIQWAGYPYQPFSDRMVKEQQ